MDQTGFSLLVGLIVGPTAGAAVMQHFTGWSGWICYLTGGICGFFALAAATMALIEWIVRSQRKR